MKSAEIVAFVITGEFSARLQAQKESFLQLFRHFLRMT